MNSNFTSGNFSDVILPRLPFGDFRSDMLHDWPDQVFPFETRNFSRQQLNLLRMNQRYLCRKVIIRSAVKIKNNENICQQQENRKLSHLVRF